VGGLYRALCGISGFVHRTNPFMVQFYRLFMLWGRVMGTVSWVGYVAIAMCTATILFGGA
jgi:hypothetical protein